MVIGNRRRAGHHPDAALFQRLQLIRQPVPCGLAVDLRLRLGQKRTAGFGIFIDQHDLQTIDRRHTRCRETRGTGADDQHIAMQVARGIGVGVLLRRRNAETRSRADEGLVDLVPEALRPHEGLVIEARRKQHIGHVVYRADIEFQARIFVLRGGFQPVPDFLHRGTGVRLETSGTAAGADQRIRLLGTRRHRAARAVVFERAAHQMHAIGEKCGGDRIALHTAIGLAIESEVDRTGSIHPATAGNAIGVHFDTSELAGARVREESSGRGSPAR